MPATGLRRQNQSDVGDGLSKAIEMVATPVLFGLLGFGLDHWIGSTPWLTVAFAAVALMGKFASEWYRYEAKMRELEAELSDGRSDHRLHLSLRGNDEHSGLPAGVSLGRADVPE